MNLKVTSSPHIRSAERTDRIMFSVLLALVPAAVAGVLVFGSRALLVMLVSVGSAVAAEWLLCLMAGRKNTVTDGSAAVTGLLFAMTLPVNVPYYVVIVGNVFAVVVIKGLCGGLGQNVFNPALAGRALVMLLFPAAVTGYAAVDGVTSATPLHHMQMPALPEESLLDMFLGNISGSIGEVSALALLIGGGYLLVRRIISIRIPASYIGTVVVLTLVFHKGDAPLLWMLYSVLGGGLMLGALFMATDYATSPVTPVGQIVYGVGCGVLTVLFRYFGIYPEGVTYAILIMNACSWAIDRYTAPRRFGVRKGGAA